MDRDFFLLYDFYMEKLSQNLPVAFADRMKSQLGDDYKKYEEALNQIPVRGVRVNTKRIGASECKALFEKEFNLSMQKALYQIYR